MLTDSDTIGKAQAQMNSCALAIAKLAPQVAEAKQAKEFNHDRMKRMLSVLVVEHLADGMSAAAAEHHARASDSYGSQLNDLADQYKSALRVIEEADAVKIKFESARSILSVEKQKLSL